MLSLLDESERLGFLGPSAPARHIDHSLGFLEILSSLPREALSRPLLDLGAGGGVPGLVIAIDRAPLETVLLDGSIRRAEWLTSMVERLGLTHAVTVIGERAEVAGRSPDWRHRFGVVVARLFGPPAVTAECAAPLLGDQGLLVVSEPATTGADSAALAGQTRDHASAPAVETGTPGELRPVHTPRWPADGLAQLGLDPAEKRLGGGYAFVTIRRRFECSERFPRRTGIPSKRPLF